MSEWPTTETDRREQLQQRRRRTARNLVLALVALVIALSLTLPRLRFDYAYLPPLSQVANPQRINQDLAYDLWGEPISRAEAEELMQSAEGRQRLEPAAGAVAIDQEFLRLGREAFYQETFGNEIFASDIVGILEGPLSAWEFAKAILRLRGGATTNLRVALAETVSVGGRTFGKGTLIDTGLDVPAGALAPLGMKMKLEGGRLRAGVTCAACHAAVDPESGKVIEGVPNIDLRIGLLLALAPNSAGFFANAELPPVESWSDVAVTVPLAGGDTAIIAPPDVLEEYVDRIFLRWPPGTFDSTADLVSNPSQIPDTFTAGDHPFGWTGFASIGPFRGLSTLNNNVHALNSDGLSQVELSEELFGFSKELTYAMTLQNAAHLRYRWEPGSDRLPSEFFEQVNPTPAAVGVNAMVPTPTFPRGSLLSPDGMLVSREGFPVWWHINAISAFENTLVPPPPPLQVEPQLLAQGEEIFTRAGCPSCHSGPAFTNNRLIPTVDLGVSPSRGQANGNAFPGMAFPPLVWSWDTPVPLPDSPQVVTVTVNAPREEILLAHAADPTGQGGFKVKGLLGLYWSPPYLHDSSIAVGPDAGTDLGLPGTFARGVLPDPANSLAALLDRQLRRRLIRLYEEDWELQAAKVTGTGHEFWVDAQAGFSTREQQSLIHYLLTLPAPPSTLGR
ncbi:MAG: cytochrome C oxidase Cbb3 [Desulfuromonadales bacterium]|nr:cytochrome C oxidase Cbb3 [Desulfuromonadales bacterium]